MSSRSDLFPNLRNGAGIWGVEDFCTIQMLRFLYGIEMKEVEIVKLWERKEKWIFKLKKSG